MVKKATKSFIVILASLILLCAILVGGIGINYGVDYALSDGDFEILHAFAAEDPADGNVMYLSDMAYDKDKSKSLDNKRIFMSPQQKKDIPGGAIQVKIENGWYTFEKGIYAHGPSYVTFDVEQYTTNGYKWFTAYGGLLPSAEKSDGAYVFVSYSSDGKNWKYYNVEPDDKEAAAAQDQDRLKNGQILIKYNQNAQYYQIDVEGVKWLRVGGNMNKSNAQDYVVFADAKLSKTLDAGEDVKSIAAFDAEIKAKAGAKAEKVNLTNSSLERLILQRELVSRVGQYALKRFKGESEDNKAMLSWLLNDLDALREFMMGGTPFGGSYYNSLTVLSQLYKSYKNDLNDKTLLGYNHKGNKWYPDRTFGELCRTMMFSVALTHDKTIGSYLQSSRKENQSEPLRRYAIFKYMYQTERFVATRNADGTWAYETMSMFESLKVEEMRWLMCNIIDDESIIWLNDYVQTRINANPKNASGLHTPHSYVRYTDPNYNNPVFYAEENYDYFNNLFAVDGREIEGNAGKKIGMWDTEYIVPAGEGQEPYVMTVSRSKEGEAKLQKVWMNFNNKFKTGSVCGGISKSGTNIRTSRGVPAHVIGQPGHAAILYYKQDANGNGSWAIDNDVGGWLAATKGERHLLGWGNATWQRNSGGTVVYFHLSQACLNDYDNLVKAEEYCWLAKVYDGDLETQEKLYGAALAVQPMNLDAWYGLTTTFMANPKKTTANFCSLVERIADTYWNHPVAMHCLFRVLNVNETISASVPNYEKTKTQRSDSVFVSQMRTAEANALTKAQASGSSAAKSKVNYFRGNTDMSVADFSFDGKNAGCIVWSDTYKGSGFRWRYSLDGKNTWSDEIIFTGDEEAPVFKLPENQLNAVSTDNDIYVYIVGSDPKNAYKIDVAAKPALPVTVYANDWENRFIGVNGTYEWRYCSSSVKETETGVETTYKPVSNWRSFAEATPDCTGDVAVEIRIKGTSKNPASDSKIFTFTKDVEDETKKYISIDYLSLDDYSTQSLDAKRPNYAANAIDGNANTYWHTDYAIDLKTPVSIDKDGKAVFARAYLVVKLDVPRWISNLEFSQRQYNSAFSIFAKTVNVYVSQDGKTWGTKPAATRTDLENMENLNVVNFESPVYGQYIKIEMAELWETNSKDGMFTTVSLINIYEDTTKKTAPNGQNVPDLSTVAPGKDGTAGFGAAVRYENVAGETIVNDEEFEGIHSSSSAVLGTTLAAVLEDYSDNHADDTFDDIFVDISANNAANNIGNEPDEDYGDNSGDNSGDNTGDGSGNNTDDNKGGNTGLIVGVVVGVIAVLAIGGAVGAYFFMKHRKAKGQSDKTAKTKKDKKAEAPKAKKAEAPKDKKTKK